MFRYNRSQGSQDIRQELDDHGEFQWDYYGEDDDEEYSTAWFTDWRDHTRAQYAVMIHDGSLDSIGKQLKGLPRNQFHSRSFRDTVVGDFIITIETRFSDRGYLASSLHYGTAQHDTEFYLTVYRSDSCSSYNDRYDMSKDPRFYASEWKKHMSYGSIEPLPFKEMVRFFKHCLRVKRMYGMI